VHEIFNHARTAAYLSHRDLALDAVSICDVLDFGGCEAYTYSLDCETGDWIGEDYDTPAQDEAPWYSNRFAQSADALGFFIESWTGLDAGHVKRSTTAIGSAGGGSHSGPISADGRVMKLNVLIFGRSNEATTYLFDWLSSALSGVCSACATSSILLRRYCPDVDNLWDGVVQLRNVGLIEGLRWESEPGIRSACYIRRASFTLEAGDPCMYLPDTDRPAYESDADADVATCLTIEGVGVYDRVNCRPSCTELNATCRTIRTIEADPLGAMAPVVTWTNSGDGYTWPFRARVYHDPHVTNADPNPCGLQILGELYVRTMRPGAKLRWDVTGRTVEYMDHSTGGWVNGWAYIEANDPPNRKFFALPCGTHQLVMEPSSLCGEQNAADIFTLEGITYDPPVFPTVSIKLSERVNCP
jgi:hypothetical protein